MPARGKHGKPNPVFPPFPPPLEIPQERRDSHIPTAATTTTLFYLGRTEKPARQQQARGWARLNRRSGPGVVAKRNPFVFCSRMRFLEDLPGSETLCCSSKLAPLSLATTDSSMPVI